MSFRMDWTLEHGAHIGPQLYRILRERVIRADLTPGSRISESGIARAYSLSRQPVREAFIKLSEDGLLEVRPQRGTYVRKISPAAVMEARFVREAVEADIVRLAAERGDSALVADLNNQVAHQHDLPNNEPDRFLELDERFHRTLAEAAGKTYAWKVIEQLKAQMDRVRYLSALHLPKRKAVEQHGEIVNAIARGNGDGAALAIRAHLREILTDLPAIVERHPDFFELEAE